MTAQGNARDYALLTSMLRATRLMLGVNQSTLAARLGTTQAYVSKTERGDRRLDLIELVAYCEALGVAADDFVLRYLRERTKPR